VADIQVVTIGVQGPSGVSGSSVPATTTTLGGVIVGNNLTVLANGLLSANAATVTNLPWANITGKPSTLAGYNITDSYPLSGNPSGFLVSSSLTPYALTSSLTVYLTTANATSTYLPSANFSFANIAGKPSTLGGYGISDGLLATTAASTYATISSLSAYAPLASPTLTGTPTAPTATAGISTTQLATTAFVTGGISTLSSTVASTYALQATTIATGAGLTGGGSLSASRTLTLATSGATAGTYGSATTVPQVTVDTFGRITGVTNVAITAGGSYTLPIATTSTLGGVRQGSGVVIDPATGILSISGSGGGTVTSVTGSTGITVTACTTAPVVSIDSAVVATLTGTQTLLNKTLTSPTISEACLTTSISCNSAPIRRGGTQREQMDASWTVTEGVCGAILVCNSLTDMTLTFPSGLSSGFNLTVLQAGAGKITIAPGSGVTLYGRNGLKTAAQYAVIGIFSAVATNTFFVTGDTTT
jgi:hypothetical protein